MVVGRPISEIESEWPSESKYFFPPSSRGPCAVKIFMKFNLGRTVATLRSLVRQWIVMKMADRGRCRVAVHGSVNVAAANVMIISINIIINDEVSSWPLIEFGEWGNGQELDHIQFDISRFLPRKAADYPSVRERVSSVHFDRWPSIAFPFFFLFVPSGSHVLSTILRI